MWNRLAQPVRSQARHSLHGALRPNHRAVVYTSKRFNSNPQNTGQYTPDPTDQDDSNDGKGKGQGGGDSNPNFKSTILKMLETAATTAASIAILG